MSFPRSASIVVTVCVLGLAGCKSEPQNPYQQGWPQGWPQAHPQQQMPQPVPGMQQQPGVQQPVQPVMPQPVQTGPAPGATVGGLIPWAELAKALPLAAPGWVAQDQAKGETAALLGFGVSTARCELVQSGMKAKVEIMDNAMAASAAGMGFAMVPTMDSSEERMGRVNIGPYHGMQTFKKKNNKAEVVVVVGNRLMVTVKVDNTANEQAALQLAQMVNYQHLAALIGG